MRFEGSPATIGSFGAALVTVLTLGLAAPYYVLRARSTYNEVTTKRVEGELPKDLRARFVSVWLDEQPGDERTST